MKIQLHSIHHAPTSLPYWHTLMDDLCNPPPDQVARVLGKSPRTIWRYNKTGFAPRVVCLAVFWLTSWGRNAVHTQAQNDATAMAGLANSLRTERDEFMAETRRLTSKCDRLKLAIGRLRGELRAEIERPRRDRKSWSEAALERSERRRISGPESQIETEWKVLLEPSQVNPRSALSRPATLASSMQANQVEDEAEEVLDQVEPEHVPTQGRYSMGRRLEEGQECDLRGPRQGRYARGRRLAAQPLAATETAPKVAGSVAARTSLADPAAAVFGSMFGALLDAPRSQLGVHESDVLDMPELVLVSEGSAGRESLPLAVEMDARAGTPPSATALCAWKPASRLDSLKTQQRRRASAK